MHACDHRKTACQLASMQHNYTLLKTVVLCIPCFLSASIQISGEAVKESVFGHVE